jgi:hypothetical protein
MKIYIKKINAIKWDGEPSTLAEIKALNGIFIYIPKEGTHLRIQNINYHGDYWVNLGDYLEVCEDKVYHWGAEIFEKTFQSLNLN